MLDANRHSPNTCEECGAIFQIDIESRKVMKIFQNCGKRTVDEFIKLRGY
jgi:hypothetical protein